MRGLTSGLILLVAFLLGSTLVLPAEENPLLKMMEYSKYHNTGVGFYEAGQYRKALYFLDKAIDISPNYDPGTYEIRAKVYFKLRQYNKAWDDVKKAQSIMVTVYQDGKKQQTKFHEVDPVFLKELRKASGREE